MNIEHIGKNSVKITISGNELKRNGLSYDKIDGDDPRTVTFITGLIRKAYSDRTAVPEYTRMNVEIFPNDGSGCVMYICPAADCTSSDGKALITAKDEDDLIKICRELKNGGTPSVSSVLAEEHGLYRLIVRMPESPALKRRLAQMCRMTDADSTVLAHIYEHGNILSPCDAINEILRKRE